MIRTSHAKARTAEARKCSTRAGINADLAVAAQVGAGPAYDHYYSGEANHEELLARVLERLCQTGPAIATKTN